MAISLILFSILFFATQAIFESSDVFAKRAYHIEEFEVKKWAPPPINLRNALAEHISIRLSTNDLTFELDLKLNQFIFDENSKIISSRTDEHGNHIQVEREYRSYRGNATIRSHGLHILPHLQPIVSTDIACVTFYPDERAHVVIITPDDIFTIDRIEVHQQSENIVFEGKNKQLGISMTRFSDYGEGYRTPFHESIMRLSEKKLSNRRNLIIHFDNCWPGQTSFDRVASVGFIADDKYYCQILTNSDTASCSVGSKDSAVMADLQSIVNTASAIYAAQFNVHLRLGDIFLGANAAKLPPNNQSCPTISGELNSLKTWRAGYYNQHSSTDSNTVVHLLTNCHPPPGVVGLAFIGVLCSAGSGYSTGVVNRVYDHTWLTFAHECGHNFGMTHSFQNGVGTTGGIMDYGSGLYQGVYQFEPTKQPEVCQQLTTALATSYSGFLPVSRCLPQYNEPTVSAPSLQPTRKPTAKPTTKPPTVMPTTSKPTTSRPTTPAPTTVTTTSKPTARPTTAKPTPKPTSPPTSVAYYARWYKTGTFGACYPACGSNSYATEIIQCCASDLSSTNKCNWQIDVSSCDPATKPTPASQKCTAPACAASLCGNGVVDSGEYCDPGADSCCAPDCNGYIVTNDCVSKNTRIDAGFTDRDGRVYLFQGPYYTRYASFSDWYYARPEAGFPKVIKGNFPIQQCTRDIAAIVAQSSNQLFVFCNSLQFVKVDLDSQIQLAGVFDAGATWKLPADFITCGQVNAGLGLSYYMLLFCQNIWISVPFTRISTSAGTLPIHSITEFGFTLQNGYVVTTVLYDRNSGQWAWFQGPENYVSMQQFELLSDPRPTQSIFNNSGINNISSLDSQGGCFQDSCAVCDNGNCKQCTFGHVLYGSRCFNNSVLAYLECNEGSISDSNLVQGGFATLLGFNYSTGITENDGSLIFDGTTTLEMKPLNKRITDFSVSAYFMPRSLNQGTFVNIDDRFVFSFQSVDASSFQVVVYIDGYEFTCYVATPILLQQWNKIQVIVKDSIIYTGANGFFHMRAFDSYQQGLNLELNFAKWEIGSSTNGINGHLDEFIVIDEGSNSGSQSESKNTNGLKIWQISLIAAGAGLVFIIIIGFVIYKCIYRQKIKEQLAVNFK